MRGHILLFLLCILHMPIRVSDGLWWGHRRGHRIWMPFCGGNVSCVADRIGVYNRLGEEGVLAREKAIECLTRANHQRDLYAHVWVRRHGIDDP